MTIKQSVQEYILSHKAHLAKNTIEVYRRNLNLLVAWIGEDTPLRKITLHDVKKFQSSLITEYSDKTLQNISNSLRPFFRYWQGMKETEVSWDFIKAPRPKEKFPDFISEDQFDMINSKLPEDNYKQVMKKLIIHLLWNTGMRVGELVSLNLSDIDIQNRYCYIRTEKSQKYRVIMWNETCHALMVKYLGVRLCLNQAPELFQTPPHTKNPRRTRLTTRSIQRWCKQLEGELNFPIRPHCYRHGKLHACLNKGGNRSHIQTIAGHSSIESSEVYVRLNIEEQKKIQLQFLPKNSPSKTKESYPWTILSNQRMA